MSGHYSERGWVPGTPNEALRGSDVEVFPCSMLLRTTRYGHRRRRIPMNSTWTHECSVLHVTLTLLVWTACPHCAETYR